MGSSFRREIIVTRTFDPDTEIGSGSTDLLLGLYHLGKITEDGTWGWFGQVNIDQPILTTPSYLPGNEIDVALGAYYNGWTFGGSGKIVPILQLLGSARSADTGNAAAAGNSGYKRVLVAPGFEADFDHFRLYADVEFPISEYYNGNQLGAPVLVKSGVSYNF